MRLFKNFALVFLFIGTLASCDGMDATYKEFIEEGPIVYIVKDLAEGSYVFEVCTYDTHGNSSIMSEVPCTVYGDVYEKLLFNTKVKTAVLKNDVLTITFAASLEPTFFGSEITYTSIDGGDKTVILKAPETQIKIDDFAGDRIIYRSVYLPEETAIDYFYSESDEFEIK